VAGDAEPFALESLPAEIRWLETTDSTNNYLRNLPSSRETRIALSWNQTAGRGRLGRSWVSRPGESLAVSIDLGHLVPENLDDSWRGAVPLIVAAELARSIDTAMSVPAVVKWPNDVLINGRKVAGILGEIPKPGRVIIGIGINAWGAPEGLVGSMATSLSAHGLSERSLFEQLVVDFLQSVLSRLLHIRLAVSPEDWGYVRARLATLGQRVRAVLPNGSEISGVAEDVDSSGCLIVSTGSSTEVISAADVEHLRSV